MRNLKWRRRFGPADTRTMKTRLTHVLLSILLMQSVLSCAPALPIAPSGYVPSREVLVQDPYGSYFSFYTAEKNYEGELLGMRNDSVFVLGKTMARVFSGDIKDGQLIIYSPSKFLFGLIMMIPNASLLIHVGSYGSAPAALALSLSLVDFIGMLPAKAMEREITNYRKWRDGWSAVMRYSRFPGGIPADLNVAQLSRRPEVKGH